MSGGESMAAEPERAIATAEMLGAVVRVTGMSGGSPAPAMSE